MKTFTDRELYLSVLQKFIDHECCQRVIIRQWSDGFDCGMLAYVFGFFIIPLCFKRFVRFQCDTLHNDKY